MTVERLTGHNRFQFAPYATAEFFYDLTTGSWNQEQYAIGIAWPYKRVLKLDTYYLYQDCSSAVRDT